MTIEGPARGCGVFERVTLEAKDGSDYPAWRLRCAGCRTAGPPDYHIAQVLAARALALGWVRRRVGQVMRLFCPDCAAKRGVA